MEWCFIFSAQSEVMSDKEWSFLARKGPLPSIHECSLTYSLHWWKYVESWDMASIERDHILEMQ